MLVYRVNLRYILMTMRYSRDNPNKLFKTTERIAFGLAVLLVPTMIALAGWTSQESPNRVDRYLFEQMGETILDGGVVYLDCWDNKPPGMAWLNAAILSVGDRSTFAITVAAIWFGVLAVATTGYGIARTTRRSVATASCIIFALVISQRYFDAVTNGTEFYAMVADAFAAFFVVTAIKRRTGRGMWYALFAGIAWGIGGMFKQTAIAGPVAVMLATLIGLILGPAPRMRWLMQAMLAMLGALIVFDLMVALLHLQGALQDAYHAVVGFNLVSHGQTHTVGLFNVGRVLEQLRPINGALLLSLLGLMITFLTPGKAHTNVQRKLMDTGVYGLGRPVVVFMGVWLVVGFYFAGVGPNHMPRYWHGLFVPMMWLVAQGVNFVLSTCRHGMRHQRWTAIAGAATLAMIYFAPLLKNIHDDALIAHGYVKENSERKKLQAVGQRVQELSEPNDRIYVLGYSAGIYRFSARRAACRYAGVDKLIPSIEFAPAMADEIYETLRESPPAVIVAEKKSVSALADDHLGNIHVPGMASWFNRAYTQVDEVNTYVLFERTRHFQKAPPARVDRVVPVEQDRGRN